MTTVANPFLTQAESNAWGIVLVDGKVPFPGVVVSVNGLIRPIDWQVQNAIGVTGAALIYKGKKLVEGITIVCELTNAIHWQQWETHYAYIAVPDGARPKVVTLGHPAFTKLAKQVFKSYPEAPEYAGKRKWIATYTLNEYKKPVKVPTGPPDPAKIDGPPKPKDAAEQALAGLLNKIENFTKDDK